MNRLTKFQIALPFLLLIAAGLLLETVYINSPLTPAEMQIYGFTPVQLDLTAINERSFRDLEHPIARRPSSGRPFPSTPLSSLAPPKAAAKAAGPAPRVSMIVVGEGRKIALVNGHVVREGDSVGGMRISRIEKQRILITQSADENTGPGAVWVYLEGIR
ncbi:MAG: hypothetical protein HZA17_13425 [Nitrospirae bacterium]|nr:hypothetical protein [Nitrospirota bacterium]